MLTDLPMERGDGGAARALNVFAVLLSVTLFARGVGAHTGFAVFMAIVVPLLLRVTLGLLVYEFRVGSWVERVDV